MSQVLFLYISIIVSLTDWSSGSARTYAEEFRQYRSDLYQEFTDGLCKLQSIFFLLFTNYENS